MTGSISGSPIVLSDSSDSVSPAHAAVRSVSAPDLLAARPRRLAGRALAARQTGIFLELVGTVERGRVGRRRQAGADAEAVDRRAGSNDFGDVVLIEPAACENGNTSKARRHRECGARCATSAIRSPLSSRTAADGDAAGGKPRRQRNDLSRSGLGVVGVDEQREIVRPRTARSFRMRRFRCRRPRQMSAPSCRRSGCRTPSRPAWSRCRQSRLCSLRAPPSARLPRRARGASRNRPCSLPGAASTMRAAFEAISVWKCKS